MNSVNVYNIIVVVVVARAISSFAWIVFISVGYMHKTQSKSTLLALYANDTIVICCDDGWNDITASNTHIDLVTVYSAYTHLLYCGTYASYSIRTIESRNMPQWALMHFSHIKIAYQLLIFECRLQSTDCQQLFFSFNVEFQLYECYASVRFFIRSSNHWLVNIDLKLQREVFGIPSNSSIPISTKRIMNAINTFRRVAIESHQIKMHRMYCSSSSGWNVTRNRICKIVTGNNNNNNTDSIQPQKITWKTITESLSILNLNSSWANHSRDLKYKIAPNKKKTTPHTNREKIRK